MEIEKGIPIPPKRTISRRGPLSKAAHLMGIGDSILCDTKGSAATLKTALYNLGGRASVRKIDEMVNGEIVRGWRVWRVA